jgi:hypothetical protein
VDVTDAIEALKKLELIAVADRERERVRGDLGLQLLDARSDTLIYCSGFVPA